MKKTLLVGTSYSAIPILKCLFDHSVDVTTCGSNRDDPGHLYSNNQIYLNYSDASIVDQLQIEQSFQYLCPSCNDYSYNTCSFVAEKHGLTGFDPYEITQTLHNKGKFRIFTERFGFPVPKARTIDFRTPLDSLNMEYPILAKPPDSFSGRGISKVCTKDQLKEAIIQASTVSKSGNIVIEEFIDGTLHSHSAFIRNGEIFFEVFADEFCTVYPYQVNCSNSPSRLKNSILSKIHECMQELVRKLNLCDGLLHTQFMSRDNDFWLIECMRRSPGDLYFKMIEASTGINCFELYTLPFIGKTYTKTIEPKTIKPISRYTISSAETMRFHSYNFNIPSQKTHIFQLKDSGSTILPAPYDKAAIMLFELDSLSSLFECTEKLSELVCIESN